MGTNSSRRWTRAATSASKAGKSIEIDARSAASRANEDEKIGRLVHKSGGPEGATWTFDYDEDRRDDDEAGYRFDTHAFVPGEYVTLRDPGASHTFRVVSVEGAHPQ